MLNYDWKISIQTNKNLKNYGNKTFSSEIILIENWDFGLFQAYNNEEEKEEIPKSMKSWLLAINFENSYSDFYKFYQNSLLFCLQKNDGLMQKNITIADEWSYEFICFRLSLFIR